jgi:hypothetical protein
MGLDSVSRLLSNLHNVKSLGAPKKVGPRANKGPSEGNDRNLLFISYGPFITLWVTVTIKLWTGCITYGWVAKDCLLPNGLLFCNNGDTLINNKSQ